MKRLILITLAIAMLLIFPMSTYAAPTNASTFETTVFKDGSYIVTTISEALLLRGTAALPLSVKTGTKTVSYYSAANTLEWTFSVNGTFSYDGTTAAATSSSSSCSIYVSGWICNDRTAWYSGNMAYASATFKYINLLTKNTSVSLSCSPSGVLS